MKAITVASYGGPEVLQYSEVEMPAAGPGTSLIKVEAAGVNYADLMMSRGEYPGGPEPGFIPGLEIAGTVVDGSRKGEKVMAFSWGGGYAEYAAAPDAMIFPLPAEFTPQQGAGFLTTYLTAYFALWMADLKPDERLLIQAAAGGVGTAAIQLAREMGAEIFAVTGSPDKEARLKQMGAEHVLVERGYNIAGPLREMTNGEGVDIILESNSGPGLERDLELLRPLGRMIVYGSLSGAPGSVDPGLLIGGNISIHGLYLGGMLADADRARMAMDELREYIRRRKLQPVVDREFPLNEAAAAHLYMRDRKNFGKLVLIP